MASQSLPGSSNSKRLSLASVCLLVSHWDCQPCTLAHVCIMNSCEYGPCTAPENSSKLLNAAGFGIPAFADDTEVDEIDGADELEVWPSEVSPTLAFVITLAVVIGCMTVADVSRVDIGASD